MHEMSLAFDICRIAEERVGRGRLPRVVEIGIEVGDDGGVEADNLEFWLQVLLSEPPFSGARPAIERCRGDDLLVTYVEIDDAGTEDRGS